MKVLSISNAKPESNTEILIAAALPPRPIDPVPDIPHVLSDASQHAPLLSSRFQVVPYSYSALND